MICSEINTRPFPCCATEIVVGTVVTPTAPPHVARIRNLATDRVIRATVSIDGIGLLTVLLDAPLQCGHEYVLELIDGDGTDAVHELTVCSQNGYAVRLRPVQEYGSDGEPIVTTFAQLSCNP